MESYAAGVGALDGGARARMDQAFLKEVLQPLDGLTGQLEELKAQMKERELIKLDFDARLRKLKLMKEKGTAGADPSEVPRKEQKLHTNAQALEQSTQGIYKCVVKGQK